MRIGYIRPYDDDLYCEEQRGVLQHEACARLFVEAHSSPKRRECLQEMLDMLQSGDTLVVARLYALADSTRHLAELVEEFESRGVFLRSIREGIDSRPPEGHSFASLVRHLVDFQTDVIRHQTKSGLYEAKRKGVVPGRPRKPDDNVKNAIVMYQSKSYSLAEIKQETGISKSTLYRYLESEHLGDKD